MLILSLAFSIGLVTCVYVIHKSLRARGLMSCVAAGVIAVGMIYSMVSLSMHAIFVLIGTLRARSAGWRPAALLVYMILAGLVPYGHFSYLEIRHVAENQRLREQYAFESMENRVSPPPKLDPVTFTKETQFHLDEFKRRLDEQGENGFRNLMLKRLHRDSVRSFIDSPGFGRVRRIEPTESTLKVNLNRDEGPIPQPGTPAATLSEGEVLKEPKDALSMSLHEMHLSSVVDFVNSPGFGWIVERRKVAGFQAHRFSMAPQTKTWRVQAVELVGILLHEAPIVYVSDKLPRMDKLRAAPTRSLDLFEARGLQELQQGKEMSIRETSQGLRMLGAVRAIDQCVKCHGAERGDLLGAFSYSLTPAAAR